MDEPYSSSRLLAWALGTFHAVLFVLSLLLLLYLNAGLGSLLTSLNTLIGFALFGALWLVTWWSTSRALRGVDWMALKIPADFGKVAALGLFWGGANGLVFLLALLVSALLIALVSFFLGGTFFDRLIGLAAYGIFGSIVAVIAGAVFGFVFAILDSILIGIARFVLSRLERQDGRFE